MIRDNQRDRQGADTPRALSQIIPNWRAKPRQAVPKAMALAEAGSWSGQALPPRGET